MAIWLRDCLCALLSLIYSTARKACPRGGSLCPPGRLLAGRRATFGRLYPPGRSIKSLIVHGARFLEGHILTSSIRWRRSFNHRDEGSDFHKMLASRLGMSSVFISFKSCRGLGARHFQAGSKKQIWIFCISRSAGDDFRRFQGPCCAMPPFESRTASDVIRGVMGWPPWPKLQQAEVL